MYCKKCSSNKESSEFYKSSKSECKECIKVRVRNNYRKNINHFKEYEKNRASLPHRVKARSDYAKTSNGLLSGNKAKTAYAKRNPEKRTASTAVAIAVRDGKLIKQPCSFCGSKIVHGHHYDYSKPLDVIWLCPLHHKAVHHGKIQVFVNNDNLFRRMQCAPSCQ